MPYHYNDFVAGQEVHDETCPNELVYHLCQLLGAPAPTVHCVLSTINPEVRVHENRLVLETGWLQQIELKLSFAMLRESREALYQNEIWNTSTITV